MDSLNQAIHHSAASDDIFMKHLTFHVAGQSYGIPISNVIEIVQIQPATKLPELPFYAKGIINLRGRLIPLIDVNLRFGKKEKQYTDRTCIIIVDINGMYVGLIVDTVDEVLGIDINQISPPPAFSGGASSRYVTGIGKLDNSMILLLNSQLLFSDTDIDSFSQAV